MVKRRSTYSEYFGRFWSTSRKPIKIFYGFKFEKFYHKQKKTDQIASNASRWLYIVKKHLRGFRFVFFFRRSTQVMGDKSWDEISSDHLCSKKREKQNENGVLCKPSADLLGFLKGDFFLLLRKDFHSSKIIWGFVWINGTKKVSFIICESLSSSFPFPFHCIKEFKHQDFLALIKRSRSWERRISIKILWKKAFFSFTFVEKLSESSTEPKVLRDFFNRKWTF